MAAVLLILWVKLENLEAYSIVCLTYNIGCLAEPLLWTVLSCPTRVVRYDGIQSELVEMFPLKRLCISLLKNKNVCVHIALYCCD